MTFALGLVFAFTLLIMLFKFVSLRRILPVHGYVDVALWSFVIFITWGAGWQAMGVGIIASAMVTSFFTVAGQFMDHEIRVVTRSPEGRRQVNWIRVSRRDRRLA